MIHQSKIVPPKYECYEISVLGIANCSVRWLASGALPICLVRASHPEQKTSNALVSHLTEQLNVLKKLKGLRTSVSQSMTIYKTQSNLRILTFSDASRVTKYGRLRTEYGLPVGPLKEVAIFYPTMWFPHMDKKLLCNFPIAEMLAALEWNNSQKWLLALTVRKLTHNMAFECVTIQRTCFCLYLHNTMSRIDPSQVLFL